MARRRRRPRAGGRRRPGRGAGLPARAGCCQERGCAGGRLRPSARREGAGAAGRLPRRGAPRDPHEGRIRAGPLRPRACEAAAQPGGGRDASSA